jgi:anti-sigma factor RsiW
LTEVIEISCEHVWREISSYIDQEIDPALRARMEEHFKHCAHCSAVLDGARNMVRLVGDDYAFDLPKGFSERLQKRIAEHIQKPR